ncbi:hypothetical protein BKA69DRAFT_1124387 [Paraphysoderma sedebokerense]|nr:hypothetical protein BKA69DRAFT_1124387 [Paraphysoderma sedebokerense]
MLRRKLFSLIRPYVRLASSLPSQSSSSVLVSSPHPVSKIRLIKLPVPHDETPQEKDYRIALESNMLYHHQFWEKNNSKFMQAQQNSGSPLFYRDFMRENRHIHLSYNMEWWKRNLKTVGLGYKALFSRITLNIGNRLSPKK